MYKYWKTQSPVLLSLLIPRTYQLATYVNLWKMEKLQLVFQLLNALKIHQITQVVPKSSGVFTTAERSICHLPWTWEAHREKVIFSLKCHIKFLYLWDFSNTIGFFWYIKKIIKKNKRKYKILLQSFFFIVKVRYVETYRDCILEYVSESGSCTNQKSILPEDDKLRAEALSTLPLASPSIIVEFDGKKCVSDNNGTFFAVFKPNSKAVFIECNLFAIAVNVLVIIFTMF